MLNECTYLSWGAGAYIRAGTGILSLKEDRDAQPLYSLLMHRQFSLAMKIIFKYAKFHYLTERSMGSHES